MYARFLLVALVAAGCGLPARAADLNVIKRYLAKEPVYQATPQYCLLVFGKEAETRIWLVRDGNTLYVDHNGNRDLTQPGKKQIGNFTVNQIVERDGTVHHNLRVYDLGNGSFSLTIGKEDHRQQYVGIESMDKPSWGDKPENAPIIHFNGPLSLDRYGPVYTVPRGGNGPSRRFKLRLVLGTPGLGKGTFASFDAVCSEVLGDLQADIEYPNPNPEGPPIKQRIELKPDG